MKYFIALIMLSAAMAVCNSQQTKLFAGDPDEAGFIDDRAALARWEFERTRIPESNSIPDDMRMRETEFVQRLNDENARLALSGFIRPSEELYLQPDAVQLQNHGVVRTGGRTRELVVDVDHENTLVIATAGGGVWRSTDDGAHWQCTSPKREAQSATCLCQDTRPGKHHIWYYGSGEAFSTGGYPTYQFDMGVGLFVSQDSAKSWTKISSTSAFRTATLDSPFSIITSVAIDPTRTDSSIIYVAANGCIMRSNNGGTSWDMVLGSASKTAAYYTDVAVSSNGSAYATVSSSSSSSIYRSKDGVVWTKISTSSFLPSGIVRVRIALAPSNPNVAWFLLSTYTPGNFLLKYTYISGSGSGSGGQWFAAGSGIGITMQTQSGYSMAITVAPNNEDHVVVGGTSLYYSTDGFQSADQWLHIGGYSKSYVQSPSWDPFTPDLYLYEHSHPDIHCLVFSTKTPGKAYLACDGGVFVTDTIDQSPSTLWRSLNDDLIAEQYYSVAIDPVGNHDGFYIGGAQDNNSNMGSRDGRPMRWVLGGDGMICEMTGGHRAVLPAYQGGQVFRVAMNESVDSAEKWVSLRPTSGSFDFITPLMLDPAADSILYMVGNNQLWRNSNIFSRAYTNNTTTSSAGWRSINLSSADGAISNASAIGVCSTPRNRVYVGSKTGVVVRIDSVQKTTPTFKKVSNSQLPSGAYVNCISVNPNDGDEVFVVFSNYGVLSVFHSTNAGTNWECIAGNLEEFPNGSGSGPACRWIKPLYFQDKVCYLLGTTSGVFWTYTLNGMKTRWYQFAAIPNVNVDMISARSTDGFIAIATHGHGIYTTYGVLSSELPLSAEQDQVVDLSTVHIHPNPARDVLSLNTKLPRSGSYSINVFDEQGRVVLSVPERYLHEGILEEPLDLSQLPAAAYSVLVSENGRPFARGSFIRSN